MSAGANLKDAEPESWKGEKAPDPSRADLGLKAAAMAFSAAKTDLEGPIGPDTNAKALRLKEASHQLAQAALAFAAELSK